MVSRLNRLALEKVVFHGTGKPVPYGVQAM